MRRTVIFAVGVALVLAACTPSTGVTTTTDTLSPASTTTVLPSTTTGPGASTTTAPGEASSGVVIGVDLAPETLNPFTENAFDARLAGNLVWATVYDIDPDTWDRVPDVVEAMPSRSGDVTVNDDGTMSVTYRIVNQATWSDGEPITGFDLAFTAAAMRDMALAGEGNVDPVMATVVGTEGDGKSATIVFSEPTLAFEDALWIVLPSHALEGVDLVNGTDGTDWPSGGPFVVDEFDPFREVSFVRNDNYWKIAEIGTRLPYFDTVTITKAMDRTVQDNEPTSPVPSFVAGSVDVALIPPTPGDFAAVENVVDDDAQIQHVATPIIEHLNFNFSDERLGGNPDSANQYLDFRRALASSINRSQILEEAGVPWLPGTPGMLLPLGESAWSVYETGITQIPELPDGAVSILSTTANADERRAIADALEPAFTAAGVTYGSDLQDSQEFFQATIIDSTYDIGMWAWVSDGSYASQLRMLEVFDPGISPPDGNFGNWGSGGTANDATARYSDIVAEARSTIDPRRFYDLIREAEAILATELPIIPLFSRGSGLAIRPDRVTGITHNGSSSTFTWNIEIWQSP